MSNTNEIIILGQKGKYTVTKDTWASFINKYNNLCEQNKGDWYKNSINEVLVNLFQKDSNCRMSATNIYQITKKTQPLQGHKRSPGLRFVEWFLNYSEEIVFSDHRGLNPHREVKTEIDDRLKQFVEAHKSDIQAPMIRAWKELTSCYSIDVILMALREIGFDDPTFAVLSRAAS